MIITSRGCMMPASEEADLRKMTLLLISQQTEFFIQVKSFLELETISVLQVESWAQVQPTLHTNTPQLVVLGCHGQGASELSLCQEIRKNYSELLVVVCESGDEYFHLLALSLGADASLAKDSGAPLIAAQIRALLRRFGPSAPPMVLTFGGLTVDANRRDVFIDGQAGQLSTLEFNLFWTLVKKAGCVVSRETIHNELYNSTYNGYDRGVDLSISRIRQKIGDDPNLPRYLKTVRGIGYQFVAGTV